MNIEDDTNELFNIVTLVSIKVQLIAEIKITPTKIEIFILLIIINNIVNIKCYKLIINIKFYMLIEKNVLLNLVEQFINNDCKSNSNEDDEKSKIKTYFKKDENNCFTIVDKEHSIKCVFEEIFLSNYLAAHPSYFKLYMFDCKYMLLI